MNNSTRRKNLQIFGGLVVLFIVALTGYFVIMADVNDSNKIISNASAIYTMNGQNLSVGSNTLSINIKTMPSVVPSLVPSVTIIPSVTATASTTRSSIPSVTVVPSAAVSRTASPAPSTRTFSFQRGYTAFGTTARFSSQLMTSQGLTVMNYDSVAKQWIQANSNMSYEIEPWKGYLVYSLTAKNVSLPYNESFANQYKLLPGWNMRYSSNDKSKSDIQIELDRNQVKSLNQWIADGKISEYIFMINNQTSSDACSYFVLLSDNNIPVACSLDGQRTFSKNNMMTAGKVFWIYVN